jgi:hypothetical protein
LDGVRSQLTQQSGITMQTQNADSMEAHPIFNSSVDHLRKPSHQPNFQISSTQLLNGHASQAIPRADIDQYLSVQMSGFRNMHPSVQTTLQDGQVGSGGLIRRAADGNISNMQMDSRVGVSEQHFNLSGDSGLQSHLNHVLRFGSENAQSGNLDQRQWAVEGHASGTQRFPPPRSYVQAFAEAQSLFADLTKTGGSMTSKKKVSEKRTPLSFLPFVTERDGLGRLINPKPDEPST